MLFHSSIRKELARSFGATLLVLFTIVVTMMLIRTLGLAGAVELASIPGTPGKRAYDIFMDCFHKGVWVRPAGENIVICPPYIVEDAHIDQIVQTVADSIRRNA